MSTKLSRHAHVKISLASLHNCILSNFQYPISTSPNSYLSDTGMQGTRPARAEGAETTK